MQHKIWDIRDPPFKICIPGRIITCSSDIQDPTQKNETEKRPKSFPLSLPVIDKEGKGKWKWIQMAYS